MRVVSDVMTMDTNNVFTTKQALRQALDKHRTAGYSIGFVPTMGALHAGHGSLIERAAHENDVVVVSVFVNPAQFGPGEDFETYPRSLASDVSLATSFGATYVFAPSVDEMYSTARGAGASVASTRIVPSAVADLWEGALRPGHFEGVVLVVTKLLNSVCPHRAYFGEKDYQQLAVVRALAADLDLPVEIVGCPIVREADGLALSSRNVYLSDSERKVAQLLSQSIRLAQGQLQERQAIAADELISVVSDFLRDNSQGLLSIGYVAFVDADTLVPVEQVVPTTRMLLSVTVGTTHLIDNASLVA